LPLDLSVDGAVDAFVEATADIYIDIDIGGVVYNVGAEPSYGDFLDRGWQFVRGWLFRNFVVKTEMVHHFGREMKRRDTQQYCSLYLS
jgi:hypothetical protein